MIIDTGAVVNMIDEVTYHSLREKPKLEKCNRQFYAKQFFEVKAIQILGQFMIKIT